MYRLKNILNMAKNYNKQSSQIIWYYYDIQNYMCKLNDSLSLKIPEHINNEAFKIVENYIKTGIGWNEKYKHK